MTPTPGDTRDPTARGQRLLDAVSAIPEGFVRTYGDLSPSAPRFTGQVLHARGADVPWWRVVRADGTLAHGTQQRVLLEAEGVPFSSTIPPRVDLSRARVP